MTQADSRFRLASSNSDVALVFYERDGDHFRVAVEAHDHAAQLRVDTFGTAATIPGLFADAARRWKGWEGVKSWESLEEALRLELRADRLGHVTLTVRVRSWFAGGDPWQLEADLALDAGQLERIAGEAARFWSNPE
jgi:hypothetical protein